MVPIITEPVQLETAGEERVIASVLPEIPLDAEGTTSGQPFLLENRTRVALDMKHGGWSLGTEWDLFTGPFAGEPWAVGVDIDERHREDASPLDLESFRARRAAIEGRLGPVQVAAGLMTSQWGLGMVANSGAADPTFGRSDFGDRVLRLRVATRPFGADVPFTVALAGDRVVADDTARLLDGQEAWQGVLAALWGKPDAEAKGGIYGVYRHQTEPDGALTQVGVLDLYGEARRGIGEGWTAGAGLEAAGILGFTGRTRSVNAVDGLDVRSLGATGYLALRAPEERASLKLRGGYASGDGDPDDATSRDFSFDRDYDVGMVLFDVVQADLNARSYAKLTDLEHTGAPPDGVDAIVDEGAFKRAIFAQPVLEARPLGWLSARAGLTLAWATAPIANPYETFRAGGTPTNQLGEPTEGYRLGTEIDWAVNARLPGQGEDAPLRPDLLVQGGHLLPSPNLGLDGVTTLLMVSARARW